MLTGGPHPCHRLRAVKMVNKQKLQMRNMYARVGQPQGSKNPENVMRREIAVMKKLHHENVVRLFEVSAGARSRGIPSPPQLQ